MNTDWINCTRCDEVDGDIVLCAAHTTFGKNPTLTVEDLPTTLTKTETLKRLRHAAKIIRQQRHFPTSYRTEVGTRLIPAYASTEEEARRVVWNKEDDLDDFDSLVGASSNPQCQGSGYIAHIYFTSGGWDGELVDVVAVWTGTSTIDPVILSR